MLDRQLRRLTAPALEGAGASLARIGVHPAAVTLTGWVVGIGACGAAADHRWSAALGLWLANRLLDGLDGPVARSRGPSEVGGLLDIVADFSVYGGFVVAVAVAEPDARLACAVLLLAYYVSGTAFLALSSLLERRSAAPGGLDSSGGVDASGPSAATGGSGVPVAAADSRSLRFIGGLAEGAETVVVYVVFCLLPADARWIAWAFAVAVGITALQRIWLGIRMLSAPPTSVRTIGPTTLGAQ